MSQIVEKRRQSDKSFVFVRESEHVAKQPGDVENPERVVEPGVESAGIDQVRHRQLANTSKPLKCGSFYDLGFVA